MNQFKRGLMLLLIVVFATACAHTNSGSMTPTSLEGIAQSGVLRVGTAANMPPLNMLDKSGVPMGLDVDLASYIASCHGR
jgi:ABC-type amino acid transport substrate-binding protein